MNPIVFRDFVRMMPKHGTKLCGECKVRKQNFRASKKLMHHSSHGIKPTCRVRGHGRSIGGRRSKHYKWYQSQTYMSVEL